MPKLFLSLLAGIVIAVPLSFALLRRGAGQRRADPPPATRASPAAGAAESTRERESSASAPPAGADAGAPAAPRRRTSSRVSGRVLGRDGAPQGGAVATLEILNDFSWKKDRELRAAADASGSFLLEVSGVRDLMVGVLTVRVPGHVDRVRTLESGSFLEDQDVGDIVIDPGAKLSGRLRSAEGVPDWSAWRIFVSTQEFPQDVVPRRNTVLSLASASGEFMVEGLPAGAARLLLYHPILGIVSRTDVTLQAGENEPVVVDSAGADPRRCIRLRVDADGLLPEGSVRLSGGGEDRVGRTSEGRTNDFLFTNLSAGSYELTIQPRKQLLWSGTASPGLVVDANIRGQGVR